MAGNWQQYATPFPYIGLGEKNTGTTASYQPTPYTGTRPPQVDVNGTNYLRGTQGNINTLLNNRAQGNDVGYSPQWLQEGQSILQNQSARTLQDQLRNSAGNLSASGLSGNPKAYQNTSGIIQRNVGTDLQNSLMGLDIANLQQKSNQTQAYTGMLQDLNTQQFGQENAGANFDLNQWQAQNGMNLSAAQLGTQQNQFGQTLQQNELAGYGSLAGTALGGGSKGTNINFSNGTGVGPYSSSSMALGPNNYSSIASLANSPQAKAMAMNLALAA